MISDTDFKLQAVQEFDSAGGLTVGDVRIHGPGPDLPGRTVQSTLSSPPSAGPAGSLAPSPVTVTVRIEIALLYLNPTILTS